MTAFERAIRTAGRRVAADHVILGAGRGLVIGAAAGLAALGLDRVAGLPVPIEAYPALVGAAVVAAAVLVMRRRPGRLALAVRLDRRLDLKDRLGTSVAVGRGRLEGPFAQLVRRDAEHAAQRLDVRRATPIRVTRVWAVGVPLAALLAAGVAFLPAVAWGAEPASTAASRAAISEQRARIVETIDEAVADLDDDGLDPASRDGLDALEELARQLEGDPTERQLTEARDQSAARLEEIADRMAEDARRNLEALDEVTRRVTDFARPDKPGMTTDVPPDLPPEAPSLPGPAEDFLESLGEGDLDRAAEQFDRIMEAAEQLPPEARQRIAEKLRELGKQLETPPDSAPDTERREQLREALKDLGADEQTIDRLLETDTEDTPTVDEALRDEGLDEQTRRELQRDLEKLREQEQVRRQAETHQRELAESLEDAARRLDQTPQERPTTTPDQPPAEGPDGPEQQIPDTPRPGEVPTERPPPPPGETPQQTPQTPPGETPQQTPQPPPGETPQQTPQTPPGETPQQTPAPQPGAEPRPGETPGEPRPDAPGPREQEIPAPGPGQREQELPGAGDAEGQQRRPLPGEGPDGKEQPSVGDILRELEKAKRDSMERGQDSERLREAGRRLGDHLTEQEKQRLMEQWMPPEGPRSPPGAGSRAGDTPGAEGPRPEDVPFGDVQDIDLRGDEDAERIIAEWLSSDDAPETTPQAGRGRGILRRARSDAEQAIEKSVVPSRYHELIQRYFGRIEETARGETSGGGGGGEGER